jgi:hypothetical protein
MTVVCRPGLSSLTRIVSALHARNVELGALRYDVGPLGARVLLDVADADVACLVARIRRLVDVVDVQVASAPPVAVAS